MRGIADLLSRRLLTKRLRLTTFALAMEFAFPQFRENRLTSQS